eukprot:TRINITY_DN6684_c0_g1_i2.p1 TRINITY_DN6684_c0_g1~~TRINITY_DN6684_c0_g1_i2.p1  ORF type:complete len:729 (+),score=107.66 TRINITY_DN6684_c0_g1_i2:188-2188(+)
MELVNKGRVRDVLILDALLRLAENDGDPDTRQLEPVLQDHNHLYVAQDPDHVHEFGKHFYGGADDLRIESMRLSIFEEAVVDAIAILTAYLSLNVKAVNKMNELHEEIYPHSLKCYGPLSEVIQVKGILALTQIEMYGMYTDQTRLEQVKADLKKQLSEATNEILKNSEYDGLFKLVIGEGGQLVPSKEEGGKPSIDQTKLQQILNKIVAEIEEEHGITIIVPRTESGKKSSRSRKFWQDYEQYHPFIKSWLKLDLIGYLMSFLQHIKDVEVHPKYIPMVRNGRTACKNPPIQQTPRAGGFREMFIPHPGKLFVIVDYNYIELCTLAAVCEHRYKFSRLADVIRHGYDPHAFTASMFSGVDFSEFQSWKNHPDPEMQEKFKLARQRAKAINFGIPSGLTPQGLGDYARTAYGVDFTLEEAKTWRTRLITEIYPEIGQYLTDCEMETLADNLGCSEKQLWNRISWKKGKGKGKEENSEDSRAAVSGGVRNILKGKLTKHDGKEYSANFVNRVWKGIEENVQDPEAIQCLIDANQKGSQELFKKLLGKDVCTLTGRVRGKVGFTQSCNTTFSGLAADGAKLALWNLTQIGFHVAGFIHDEMLVEIPEDSDWDREIELIVKIICSSMQELVGTIPIKCEFALSRMWSKQATAVYGEDGCIKIWEPKVAF